MNKIMTGTLDALKIAREALKERRGYCSQWEYKYGHEWDNEDGYIQHAIDKLAELDRIESEKPVEDVLNLEELISGIRGRKLYNQGGSDFMWTESLCEKELLQFAERYHQSRMGEK